MRDTWNQDLKQIQKDKKPLIKRPAHKVISITQTRLNQISTGRMLIVAGSLINYMEGYSISINCMTEDFKRQREKAFIAIQLPDGSCWNGSVNDLWKILKIDKTNLVVKK